MRDANLDVSWKHQKHGMALCIIYMSHRNRSMSLQLHLRIQAMMLPSAVVGGGGVGVSGNNWHQQQRRFETAADSPSLFKVLAMGNSVAMALWSVKQVLVSGQEYVGMSTCSRLSWAAPAVARLAFDKTQSATSLANVILSSPGSAWTTSSSRRQPCVQDALARE